MTDPTVLLISVGTDSTVLADEIERKGLRVVSCPFAEAEEMIEREKPLLVVLHGARGAVELSTMLEDAEDPPQVAVVAARADLGTLMGLNRDIVVSLLATELTEKTVAVRLEAVARQRAKALGLTLNLAARRMSLGPRPSLSRPAPKPTDDKPQNLVLEAPTPDLHARPKAPAPPALDAPAPSSRANMSRGMSPTSVGSSSASSAAASPGGVSRAAKPPAEEAKGTPRAPRVSSGTAIGLPAPGRPDPGPQPPRRPPPREPAPQAPSPPAPATAPESSVLSASLLLSDIPQPAAPPPRPAAAPAPSAARSPSPAPDRSAPVRPPSDANDGPIDSDIPTAVISLTPSVIESLNPQEATEAPRPIAPAAPPIPRFDPSDLLAESGLDDSVGPDLRNALSLERPGPLSGPLSSSKLGGPSRPEPEQPSAPLLPRVSAPGKDAGASDVLDRLVAPPAFGEAETVPPGSKAAVSTGAQAAPDSGAYAPKPPLPEDDEDELALPLLRPSRSPDADSDDFSTGMLTEVTMPAIPGSLAAEALAEARLRSEPNHPIPEPPDDRPDLEHDRATVTGAAPTSARASQPALAAPRPLELPSLTAPPEPRKKSSGALIAACAVVATLGGAAAYIKWGIPKTTTTRASKEPAPAVAPARNLPDGAAADAGAAVAPGEEPPDLGDPDDPDPTPAADANAAPNAGEAGPEEPATEAPATEAPTPEGDEATGDAAEPNAHAGASTTEPAVLLDNPFATPDANLPGCDQLVPADRPTSPDPVTEASVHWAAARKNIVKGDIEGATRSMCLATALNPQSPAVEGLARLYTLSHSPTQALIWVERAIQQAPTNRELISLRGDAKSQLGRQDEATLDWLEAMGIAPDETKRRTNQAAEYTNIGRTERGRSDLAKAEQFFRRALGFEETNLAALTGMAEVMLARKLYDQAGSFAVKALAVFEPVPEAYLVLGDVALAKNDPARARASFERALAIRPDFWAAKTRLRDLRK